MACWAAPVACGTGTAAAGVGLVVALLLALVPVFLVRVCVGVCVATLLGPATLLVDGVPIFSWARMASRLLRACSNCASTRALEKA